MKSSLTIVSFLFLIFATACTFSLAADVTPPPGYQPPPPQSLETTPVASSVYPPVPPNPADGGPIYAEKCAPCHGVTGLGNGPRASQLPNPVAPLGSPEVARAATPGEWYTTVTNGNLEKFMPPFDSLTERQRWDVVAYALGLSTSPAELAEAAGLYQENCASCHGQTGKGDGPKAASLASPVADFSSLSYMANISTNDLYDLISAGKAPDMPAFEGQLSEAERWSLSDYIRSLSFSTQSESASEEAVNPTSQSEQAQAQTTPAATAIPTDASGQGTIQGKVTLASSENTPENLEIALHAFEDATLVYSDTTQIKADGTYSFNNIEMPPGRVFITTTEFQDMIYRSDRGEVSPGVTTLDLPIQIYESTTDTTNISVDRLHLFLENVGEDILRVSELYIISNTDTKTLVASAPGQPVIEYDLPEGATNLQFQDGLTTERFVSTEDGFGDLLPIVPGVANYQLLYSYDLPYNRKLDYSQVMNLPVKAVLVAIPEDGIKVKGPGLVDGGTVEAQDGNFHIYNGQEINKGSSLEITIIGQAPGSTTLSGGSRTGIILGIAAFGLALLFAGLWVYSKMKSQKPDETGAEIPAEPNGKSSESSDTLMDAILALDDLYKEGKLPEEAYKERRNELKTRLKELLDREQNKTS
jgi:mono/diheme cytochrome c family protein